jgi:hypothetical protein
MVADSSALTVTHSWIGRFRPVAMWSVLALMGVVSAWFIIVMQPYKAGEGIGYAMGLTGGSMMLLLLLYPLRKHFKIFQRLGALRHWFSIHMTMGVMGPLLVIYHTTFHLGSLNAKVAFLSMMLVALSGVIGRFIYVRIHHGLYGRAASLEEFREQLVRSTEGAKTLFAHAPDIRERLFLFHGYALDNSISTASKVFRFMTVRLRGRILISGLKPAIKQAVQQMAKVHGWSAQERRIHRRVAYREASDFIASVCSVAQFRVWKKLFSLWHIAHVPFVFLLVGSGIAHVVAVHLY